MLRAILVHCTTKPPRSAAPHPVGVVIEQRTPTRDLIGRVVGERQEQDAGALDQRRWNARHGHSRDPVQPGQQLAQKDVVLAVPAQLAQKLGHHIVMKHLCRLDPCQQPACSISDTLGIITQFMPAHSENSHHQAFDGSRPDIGPGIEQVRRHRSVVGLPLLALQQMQFGLAQRLEFFVEAHHELSTKPKQREKSPFAVSRLLATTT